MDLDWCCGGTNQESNLPKHIKLSGEHCSKPLTCRRGLADSKYTCCSELIKCAIYQLNTLRAVQCTWRSEKGLFPDSARDLDESRESAQPPEKLPRRIFCCRRDIPPLSMLRVERNLLTHRRLLQFRRHRPIDHLACLSSMHIATSPRDMIPWSVTAAKSAQSTLAGR